MAFVIVIVIATAVMIATVPKGQAETDRGR
jgi:hypothetical protein